MSEWKEYKLDEIAEVLNNKRVPLNSQQREKMKGIYPYYGASGIVDYVDSFIFDGEHVLISEDGENLRSRNTPIAFKADGRFWVNNHAHILKGKTDFLNDWIVYYFMRLDINPYITGAVQPKLNKENLLSIPMRMPDFKTVESIASILSSLDDKIELNNAINKNLEALAQALYKRWFVDFEFPCLPQNYRFSGHVNQASGIIKPEDFDSVMTYSRVGGLPVPDGKSWFVYVLLCSNGSFYKGITNDLYRRFYEHYKGLGADWTRSHKPVKVIHWEAFQSKQDAAKREKELKTGYGRTWLERQYAKIINGSPAPECKLRMAGEMVESELGMIPKGWRVKAFKEVVEKYIDNRGKTPPTTNFGIPLVEVRDLSDSSIFPSLKTQKHVTEDIFSSWFRAYLEPNDVLISTVGTIGRCNIVPENRIFAIAQNVLGIRFKKDILDQKYMFCLMRSKSFVDEVYSRLIVTVQASIKRSDLEKIPVMVPPIGIIKSFSFIVNHNFQLILTNSFENELLVSLRNVLLPKLISGELEINEVLTETKKVL